MAQKNDTPRTWFARSAAGDATVFVRRFEEVDSAASYEVYGYSGDLTSEASLLALPEDMPESFASLHEALRHGAIVAGRPMEAFADVTGGRRIELDLATALRSCSAGPLHMGMPAEELEAALGVLESIMSGSPGAVPAGAARRLADVADRGAWSPPLPVRLPPEGDPHDSCDVLVERVARPPACSVVDLEVTCDRLRGMTGIITSVTGVTPPKLAGSPSPGTTPGKPARYRGMQGP